MRETKYWGEKITVLNEMQDDEEYLSLEKEDREKLFNELMTM